MSRKTVFTVALLVMVAGAGGCGRGGDNWYKGNTHTHSLWSDGDAAPEVVADWYRTNDYRFLVLTDHDILSEGERWFDISNERRSHLTDRRVDELRDRFGSDWVVIREREGQREMKLKTLEELRRRFEVPGEFIFIQGEEISDSYEGRPLHLNAINLLEFIPKQGGDGVQETFRRNVRTVLEQEGRLRRPIAVSINHPNWRWAVTPEELAAVEDTGLFEVYNGSVGCNNYGDQQHPGMDDVWDIALTLRLTELGLGPLFGIATDDTHDYFTYGPTYSNPGRGWIVVRAPALEPDYIAEAIKEGDFYSSTGVELKDIRISRSRYYIEIEEEEGVTYTTRFIGTRVIDGRQGDEGEILMETADNPAVYRLDGDELYVRAKVISSKRHSNYSEGEEAPQYAWTQPLVPPVE